VTKHAGFFIDCPGFMRLISQNCLKNRMNSVLARFILAGNASQGAAFTSRTDFQ
jgi:hypothetical protein